MINNIKEEIGKRIYEARKDKGLTRKALAELTDDLKPSRISNWESGLRSPGPQEIKQLAKALDLSPAFLMCLTDENQVKRKSGLGVVVPLLNHKQACDPVAQTQTIKDSLNQQEITYIPLVKEFATDMSENGFAIRMKDDSMEPELKIGDILIVDPDQEPNPGGFVVARVGDNDEVIVRRYKQISVFDAIQEYELVVSNDVWADIHIDSKNKGKIVGAVITLVRKFN